MPMSQKFPVKLHISNLGPHSDKQAIDFYDMISTNKIVIFAQNGEGKTFISRAFRLCELNNDYNSDDILTLGKHSGKFIFSVNNKKLDIDINRGKGFRVQNECKYIFHVFNSDYVEENVVPANYIMDNTKATGYILSKAQIDLTADKVQEKLYSDKYTQIKSNIEHEIQHAKKELQDLGVQHGTIELKKISWDDLQNADCNQAENNFDEIVEKLRLLENVPENIEDVPSLQLNIDVGVIEDIRNELKTTYTISKTREEFLEYYGVHHEFIKDGVAIFHTNQTVCPFCQREVDAFALSVINQYEKFQNDKEAEAVSRIETLSTKIKTIFDNLQNYLQRLQGVQNYCEQIKKYFTTIPSDKLKPFVIMDEQRAFVTEIQNLLKTKSENIGLEIVDNGVLDYCKLYLTTCQHIVSCNQDIINVINTIKNNKKTERLRLRRELCNEQFIKYANKLAPFFKELEVLARQLTELKNSIIAKENSIKISRHQKVYETLKIMLDKFFHDKYTVNERDFSINFYNNVVGNKVTKILSDGEKSIVAFCLYIAMTHSLINNEDEYGKLFFVIDDPISSMDFNHVYTIAQILRHIDYILPINEYARLLILTHNLDFYGVLVRNKIIGNHYMLSRGKIQQIDSEMLIPYIGHLKAVINVANGQEAPNFTTGNSIRQILETICKFEFPNQKMEEFIACNSTLSQSSNLYTLCQDLSHGNLSGQPPITPQQLIEACKTVKKFLEEKYPGQIQSVST